MTLQPGDRLGPYEILALVGAGGMGEVYRARDTRLRRDVALKVLPSGVATDPDRLRRFEQEARAASALNHPNIITLHDIGKSNAHVFVAMEHIDGKTLRDVIAGQPLAPKRLLEIAAQLADGLSKAHAAGIVHRDLKPENVMISKDGFVKILDFGLAKLAEDGLGALADGPTVGPGTAPGTVLGTVGYMSPEQASGGITDFRSDQFSLGTMLYEMATGRRAFERKTSAETLTAIIREDPEPLEVSNPKAPMPLRWIVERCLAKDPEDRYASTKDLARDLKRAGQHLSEPSIPVVAASARPRRRGSRGWAALAAVALLAIPAAFVAGRRTASVPQPTFKRLTFNRGWVTSARFAPAGQMVVFSATWDGGPMRTYSLRPGMSQSAAIELPDSELLSLSDSGDMAIIVNPTLAGNGFNYSGTLARVPISGGVPKSILEDVSYAEWAPSSNELAVVHHVAGRDRLEFPIGKVLRESSGWLQHPRFSPDGQSIAVIEHASSGDDGDVVLLDLSGHARTLATGWASIQGLAWRPDGKEIWFTAAREGINRQLSAVTPSGAVRSVRTMQGTPALLDVGPHGEALVTEDDYRQGVLVISRGETRTRDLGWFDWTSDRSLTPDGKLLLFDESGEGGGAQPAVYLRPIDGSPAVRLAEGLGVALSADGSWALTRSADERSHFVLVPVGAGQPRSLPPDGMTRTAYGALFADGKRFAFEASAPGHGTRIYIQDLGGGGPRPISDEGINTSRIFISPDSRWIAAIGSDSRVHLYPAAGGPSRPLAGSRPGDYPSGWSSDGTALYVSRIGLPSSVDLVDVTSGRRTKVRDLAGTDAAGVLSFGPARVTPDGQTVAFGYTRILSTLYGVQGLQ
jgi:Tol biopolymer transport system component/predicted Ser/Thr protein kinase